MSERFDGKVVLITGAGSGIGLATARQITGEGGRVALVDRDADTVKKAADELAGSIAIATDVSEAGNMLPAPRTCWSTGRSGAR